MWSAQFKGINNVANRIFAPSTVPLRPGAAQTFHCCPLFHKLAFTQCVRARVGARNLAETKTAAFQTKRQSLFCQRSRLSRRCTRVSSRPFRSAPLCRGARFQYAAKTAMRNSPLDDEKGSFCVRQCARASRFCCILSI